MKIIDESFQINDLGNGKIEIRQTLSPAWIAHIFGVHDCREIGILVMEDDEDEQIYTL